MYATSKGGTWVKVEADLVSFETQYKVYEFYKEEDLVAVVPLATLLYFKEM